MLLFAVAYLMIGKAKEFNETIAWDYGDIKISVISQVSSKSKRNSKAIHGAFWSKLGNSNYFYSS